jgi:4-hydroxybenzoate polyprenyltransferase
LFSGVFASDGKTNLSGSSKLKILKQKFGSTGFDYAGNANIDLKIWTVANHAILVNASNKLINKAKRITVHIDVFNQQINSIRVFLKAIRIHQYAKNILIFIPIVTAHKLMNGVLFLNVVYAFIAFSLCASSVYILNDLLDLEADRHHSNKRFRPFAAGDLSILLGIVFALILLSGSVGLACLLPINFLYTLGLYYLLTVSYSFYLKKVVLVDVILLAMLYTIRIIAGAMAINVFPSEWLMAFSMFLIFSLALVKRYSELYMLRQSNKESTKGRGYLAGDLEQLSSMGAASGYISVLVFALYINSEKVTTLYNHSKMLWLICPAIMYWISRVWLLAHRGKMPDDPILFAVKDKISYIVGIWAFIIMLVSAN